jgi:hypothetical protein
VIGAGIALYLLGLWITTIDGPGPDFGWVAYAPLSRTINPVGFSGSGLQPWVRFVIWLVLTVIWVGFGVLILRSPSSSTVEETATSGDRSDKD